MMCEFLLPRSRFCVTSAPGTTSMLVFAARRARPRPRCPRDSRRTRPRVTENCALPERGDARRRARAVALHQDVIGDRNHVERPRPAVEIDRPRAPTGGRRSTACARGNRRAGTARSQACSGPHVQMCAIRRPVVQHFGPEVADVEPEHRALPHRPVAARRGVHASRRRQRDTSDGRQPARRGSCPRRETRSRCRSRRCAPAPRGARRSCRRRRSRRCAARAATSDVRQRRQR